MSRRDPMNNSVFDQHLAHALKAVLLVPGAERLYGYAALTGTRENPEIVVHTFADQETMILALSETFNGRLLSDIYPDVYRFGPDQSPRLRLVVEQDDDPDDEDLDE